LVVGLLIAVQFSLSGQISHAIGVTSNVFTPNELHISAGDTVVWTNTQGNHNVNGTQATFPNNPESFGNDVGAGWVFTHVFTIPGDYDYRCNPHFSFGMTGKITVADAPPDTLIVNLTGMVPHIGQQGFIRVTDDASGEELERSGGIIETDSFTLKIPGIVSGHSYTIDLYADLNGNGYYDAPPLDHAWRMGATAAGGNLVVDFAHNTDFTDIEWVHRLEMMFSGMAPHLGQMLTLYVRDLATGNYLDTVVLEAIEDPVFDIHSNAIEAGGTYMIDFYADLNGNGLYDAPPVDHAWRLETGEAVGDVIIEFAHNTVFTDIFEATGLDLNDQKHRLAVYPNPASDNLFVVSEGVIESISIFSITGAKLLGYTNLKVQEYLIPLDGIRSGSYILKIRTIDDNVSVSRLLKK